MSASLAVTIQEAVNSTSSTSYKWSHQHLMIDQVQQDVRDASKPFRQRLFSSKPNTSHQYQEYLQNVSIGDTTQMKVYSSLIDAATDNTAFPVPINKELEITQGYIVVLHTQTRWWVLHFTNVDVIMELFNVVYFISPKHTVFYGYNTEYYTQQKLQKQPSDMKHPSNTSTKSNPSHLYIERSVTPIVSSIKTNAPAVTNPISEEGVMEQNQSPSFLYGDLLSPLEDDGNYWEICENPSPMTTSAVLEVEKLQNIPDLSEEERVKVVQYTMNSKEEVLSYHACVVCTKQGTYIPGYIYLTNDHLFFYCHISLFTFQIVLLRSKIEKITIIDKNEKHPEYVIIENSHADITSMCDQTVKFALIDQKDVLLSYLQPEPLNLEPTIQQAGSVVFPNTVNKDCFSKHEDPVDPVNPIVSIILPTSLEQLYNDAIVDHAPHSILVFFKDYKRYEDIYATLWNEDGYRKIQVKTPIKSPIGPPKAILYRTQRMVKETNKIVIHNTIAGPDIPFGKSFVVLEIWTFEAISATETKATVQAVAKIQNSSWTMKPFVPKLKSGVVENCSELYEEWSTWIKAVINKAPIPTTCTPDKNTLVTQSNHGAKRNTKQTVPLALYLLPAIILTIVIFKHVSKVEYTLIFLCLSILANIYLYQKTTSLEHRVHRLKKNPQ